MFGIFLLFRSLSMNVLVVWKRRMVFINERAGETDREAQ